MTNEPENIYINVELNQKTSNTLQKAFDFIVKNHSMEYQTIGNLSQSEAVDNINHKLSIFSSNQGNAVAQIPMTKSEWVSFRSLLDYASTVLPADWTEEKGLLDNLLAHYNDLDNKISRSEKIKQSIEKHRGTLEELSQR